jgi:hypothetical protein
MLGFKIIIGQYSVVITNSSGNPIASVSFLKSRKARYNIIISSAKVSLENTYGRVFRKIDISMYSHSFFGNMAIIIFNMKVTVAKKRLHE